MAINENGILEAPYNLYTLSRVTKNPCLDVGLQCCDCRPVFEYKWSSSNGDEYAGYVKEVNNGTTPLTVNVYSKAEEYVIYGDVENPLYTERFYTFTKVGEGTLYSGSNGSLMYNYISLPKTSNIFYEDLKRINPWAKYKPIVSNTTSGILGEVTDTDRESALYGFDSSVVQLLEDPKVVLDRCITLKGQWMYKRPTPGQTDYFRMNDFNEYNRHALPEYSFKKNYNNKIVWYGNDENFKNSFNVDLTFTHNINSNVELPISAFLKPLSNNVAQDANNWYIGCIYRCTTGVEQPIYYKRWNTVNNTNTNTSIALKLASSMPSEILALDGITFDGCFVLTNNSTSTEGEVSLEGGNDYIYLPNSYFTYNITHKFVPIYYNINSKTREDIRFFKLTPQGSFQMDANYPCYAISVGDYLNISAQSVPVYNGSNLVLATNTSGIAKITVLLYNNEDAEYGSVESGLEGEGLFEYTGATESTPHPLVTKTFIINYPLQGTLLPIINKITNTQTSEVYDSGITISASELSSNKISSIEVRIEVATNRTNSSTGVFQASTDWTETFTYSEITWEETNVG